ncbi:vacuolar membrane protein-domain-containing protein [Pyronema domesticum]|uniref:Similar to Vacuolar membrane protein YPL162C acc. no. Q12042 n=1 Tax=Pyronema omphalodes (strain CBS 100304) TaxID=1076935 RepID=U4LUW2_PYROM|nr:vacuolar membrane protein-domain-containing protein [Pyronema domesticum]CCX34062.1 Similar to Vacuolar membrane protein YPL162C; acc. no. Q12042 [Pyronema omphalodes CBS 100304]
MNTSGAAASIPTGNEDNGRCDLLGPFALVVQGALGAVAFLVLLWKRSRERPQRPFLIWWMDASKQVFGSVLVHMANLLLSMISSGTLTTEPSPTSLVVAAVRRSVDGGDEGYHANPCSFYLLNLGIDTTIGVIFLIYSLKFLNCILELCKLPGFRTGITSGYYGDPPQWGIWAKQSVIYFTGLMMMKFIVFIMFVLFPWLGKVGDFLLAWTEGDRRLQIFFVMFFFPLVMNAFQYWVIDSYIKHPNPYQNLRGEAVPDGPPLLPYNVDESDSEDEAAVHLAQQNK